MPLASLGADTLSRHNYRQWGVVLNGLQIMEQQRAPLIVSRPAR